MLCFLGLGVGRDGAAEDGVCPGPPVGGPGVGIDGRFCSCCNGVPIGVACGLTPFAIMVPLGVGMAAPVAPGAVAVGPLGVPGYPFGALMLFGTWGG